MGALKLYEQGYNDTRDIAISLLIPTPEALTISIEEGCKTSTSSSSTQILTLPHKSQWMILKKDEKIIKVSTIPQPFPTISLEDFIGKYFLPDEQKLMWEQFKKDLWQEVVNGKISKIKYYRIVHKLTQEQLAKKLNMKQPNIVRLEKMGYKPDVSTLEKLGKVFRIDYKELL